MPDMLLVYHPGRPCSWNHSVSQLGEYSMHSIAPQFCRLNGLVDTKVAKLPLSVIIGLFHSCCSSSKNKKWKDVTLSKIYYGLRVRMTLQTLADL